MALKDLVVRIELDHLPKRGQNTDETRAHAKLRLGCVSSSSSSIRYRAKYER